MFKDYFLLALGNLRHRGIRSWLTMLGIFIGIAAVVSLISLGNGLENAITGQFDTLSADKLTIQNAGTGFGPPGSTVIKKLNNHDVNIIKNTPGIDRVLTRLIRIGKFEYNKQITYSYIGSVPSTKSDADLMYKVLNLDPQEGHRLFPGDKGKILLGNDFTNENTYGKRIKVGTKVTIQGKQFEVIGILEKSSSFILNSVVIMLEDDMRDLLNLTDDETDIIVAQVANEKTIEKTAEDVKRNLRKDRNEKVGEEDFSVQTPKQAISAVDNILKIVNIIIGGIAAISLLIGAVGITNTMYTSVLERTKEIGTMKAVGARNRDVLLIFLIESALLGVVGGLVGIFIGLGLAFIASAGASAALGSNLFKVTISWPLLWAALLFSSVVGIGAGILPAIQASKLRPTEALRS